MSSAVGFCAPSASATPTRLSQKEKNLVTKIIHDGRRTDCPTDTQNRPISFLGSFGAAAKKERKKFLFSFHWLSMTGFSGFSIADLIPLTGDIKKKKSQMRQEKEIAERKNGSYLGPKKGGEKKRGRPD